MNWTMTLAVGLMLLAGTTSAETNAELQEQVRQAETAFAKTMADRDHAAFTSFLAEEAIFVGRSATRGKAAVAADWKRFYEGPDAPFSWAPERVEVLDSGTLALSTGPVFAPNGRRTGQFNSTWRREADGRWRVVLDNGCNCGPQEPPPPPATPASPRP